MQVQFRAEGRVNIIVRAAIALLCLAQAVIVPSALADWQIQSKRDATTGRMSKVAALMGTHDAILAEICREDADGLWSYFALLLLPPRDFAQPIKRQVRYRLDNEEVRQFESPAESGIVRPPGGSGVEWMSALTDKGAKVLTIETLTDAGRPFVTTFDLGFASPDAALRRTQFRLDCFLTPSN